MDGNIEPVVRRSVSVHAAGQMVCPGQEVRQCAYMLLAGGQLSAVPR